VRQIVDQAYSDGAFWHKQYTVDVYDKKGSKYDFEEIVQMIMCLLSQARKEGIEEFADWVWEGWNLDLAGKDRAVKHFLELKEKEGR